ncbi:arylsulfatase [Saccharicrinis fermentans]|uniref:Arylsulfatase n=1 Tax=Saccharicrinis fermentans DSM 9555 = JCM 21142 TaxID=869213 RepID=W7Y2G8_9BACT|nr:arylsulfatase [Saccharicrinis fermentans]GAF02137.1 arylsulfatase [Saccharicrinis fermentans DSM 9555 = JCM 21142]
MKVLVAIVFLLLIIFTSCSETSIKKQKKPNIIYILADDAGYGDFSCYGQTAFQTPNIDKLAQQGMKFTQHYCGASVCAPSRSTLMTGLHTGHTAIRGNRELKDREGQLPMAAEYVTVAELLKKAGYVTGAFGKWGLGFIGSEGDAINQGFDVFYGYNCQRMAHRYYPPYLWDNDEKDFLDGNDWKHTVTYAPDVIQEKTLAFIEDNKNKPFFAYVPLIQPHAELLVPEDSIFLKFKGKFEEPKNYKEIQRYGSDYGSDIVLEKYCYQKYPKATFVSMIYRMDVYVGQIMAKLEELGIADNTIIMFASDNGPHDAGGANPVYFNSAAGFRGMKRDLYEGGIRTPFIVKWPAKVKAGTQSDHVSAFWDFLPTCADIAGVNIDHSIDGISFLPTLTGAGVQKKHDFLYWEFAHKGGKQALRMGQWKAVINKINSTKNAKLELYNLNEDKEETNDVAADYPGVVEKMKQTIVEQHVSSNLFPLFKEEVQ